MEMIDRPRWEDYELKYVHVSQHLSIRQRQTLISTRQSNPFMFMGNGVSQREAHKQDLTFCKSYREHSNDHTDVIL